jgi:hypothetical protein
MIVRSAITSRACLCSRSARTFTTEFTRLPSRQPECALVWGTYRCRCIAGAVVRVVTPRRDGPYFAGLSLELRLESSISPQLRSTSIAACIQVLAISSNIWRAVPIWSRLTCH